MVIGIVENLRGSYEYANKALHSFSDWVILITICLLTLAGTVLMAVGLFGFIAASMEAIAPGSSTLFPESIPFAGVVGAFSLAALCIGVIFTLIFSILWTGFILRVYRGGELKLGSWGGMFLDGLLATIISLVYCIPYIVISVLLMFGPMDNAAFVLGSMVIRFVVLLITCMVLIMALIRFAKEQRFGAAFQMKELFNVIATIGWLRYLGNIIVVGVVLLIICVILLVIVVVGWVLLLVVMPLLTIWEAKFFTNLYESAVAASAPAVLEE
ncbi:MAG: DUF4013 domain-containing protein [Methanocorpusculum sp.]|nr:DUF4013 domain-containing protein [Methanocorpusculum sp.]